MKIKKGYIKTSLTEKRKGVAENNIKINYESIEEITDKMKKEIDELYKNKGK